MRPGAMRPRAAPQPRYRLARLIDGRGRHRGPRLVEPSRATIQDAVLQYEPADGKARPAPVYRSPKKDEAVIPRARDQRGVIEQVIKNGRIERAHILERAVEGGTGCACAATLFFREP